MSLLGLNGARSEKNEFASRLLQLASEPLAVDIDRCRHHLVVLR
jgi:hypothetical protein